jgi:hypothetical protein
MAASPSPRAAAPDPANELVLLTREGCHLCDEALDTIRDVLGARGTAGQKVPSLRIVDIDGHPPLESAYGQRIPVIRIAGEELELVISARRLTRLLERVLDGVTTA